MAGDAAEFQSFIDTGLINEKLSKDEQWKKYKELKKKDDESVLDKLSVDFRDFDYLNSLPDRGGLPAGIKTPLQYVKYSKQLEQDIKDGKSNHPRGTPFEGSITSLEDIKNAPVQDITKAVMSGLIQMKELTPTDKRGVAEDLYKVGFNPKQYIVNKLNGMISLYAAMPEDQKGYIEGFVKPWAVNTVPSVAQFESARTLLTREIARLFDVGVLSDQDVASYTAAMASRQDSGLPVVIAKISGISQATGGKANENTGKTGTLKDGRPYVVGTDGETLLDPNTGKELE